MQIELKSPFDKIWKKAYIVINRENRKTVLLYNSKKDRCSISYAKYLMCCREGRILNRNEHVDHIDEDKTNDVIENLQILSPIKNIRKSLIKPLKKFVCPICQKEFYPKGTTSWGKEVLCCSKKCGNLRQSETWKQKRLQLNNGHVA